MEWHITYILSFKYKFVIYLVKLFLNYSYILRALYFTTFKVKIPTSNVTIHLQNLLSKTSSLSGNEMISDDEHL
jgi:hypothetical protein